MANLSDFMPRVLPYVVGCSYPLAEMHVRDICIDFCTHAPVVQVALDPISAVANQPDYDFESPSGSVVTLILEAWFQGVPLTTYKTGDVIGINVTSGVPTAIKQSSDAKFTFNYVPNYDVVDAITMNVATKPSRKTMTVADTLLDDYGYEIGLGVASRLMLIPGQTFTNIQMAMQFKAEYEMKRADARIRAEASFGLAASFVRPRRFI
jgi:hypothetical protein